MGTIDFLQLKEFLTNTPDDLDSVEQWYQKLLEVI